MGRCVFEIFATLELSLVLIDGVFDVAWLPLGGGPLQQIGICLGTAHVIGVLAKVFRPP
jgi:hypothetical protein